MAGLAALLTLAALRSPAAPAAQVPDAVTRPGPAPGSVAVPITLTTPALARTVAVGDVVDIVSVSSTDDQATPTARVVARAVRVIDVPDQGGSFTSASTPVLVLEVPEGQAVGLIASSLTASLAVTIRHHSGSH